MGTRSFSSIILVLVESLVLKAVKSTCNGEIADDTTTMDWATKLLGFSSAPFRLTSHFLFRPYDDLGTFRSPLRCSPTDTTNRRLCSLLATTERKFVLSAIAWLKPSRPIEFGSNDALAAREIVSRLAKLGFHL